MREIAQLQRRPLPGELVGYEIRLGAHPLVRVTETPEGWHVMNVAAASAAVVPIRSRADDMADRIVRISVL